MPSGEYVMQVKVLQVPTWPSGLSRAQWWSCWSPCGAQWEPSRQPPSVSHQSRHTRGCMVKALSILPLVQGLGQGFVTPKQRHLQSLCLSIGTLSLSLVWLMLMGMLVDFQRLSTGVIPVQELLYD